MKCIKCGKEGAKYIERRPPLKGKEKKLWKRTKFKAVCKECGFEGEIK